MNFQYARAVAERKYQTETPFRNLVTSIKQLISGGLASELDVVIAAQLAADMAAAEKQQQAWEEILRRPVTIETKDKVAPAARS